MERIKIALGNLQGREVLLNEGVENEEHDNITLLAGHSPRGGRGRRRGREIFAQKRFEREYQYERGEERGVGGVKLKIPTFYGKSDPDEYLQYERKTEHVLDCNNFNDERKLKFVVAEFCDYAIIWWTSLKSKGRNYENQLKRGRN